MASLIFNQKKCCVLSWLVCFHRSEKVPTSIPIPAVLLNLLERKNWNITQQSIYSKISQLSVLYQSTNQTLRRKELPLQLRDSTVSRHWSREGHKKIIHILSLLPKCWMIGITNPDLGRRGDRSQWSLPELPRGSVVVKVREASKSVEIQIACDERKEY